MRIISGDSRRSERLGDVPKLPMARGHAPWCREEAKLCKTSQSCAVNQSSSERGRCFAPGAYSVFMIWKESGRRPRNC
jgi:hypothetical protein